MKRIIYMSLVIVYALFIIISNFTGFQAGIDISQNFQAFFKMMIKILPCAFLLIGLFEVWVKRETVEKHLGKDSNFMSYVWMILLASTTVGGLYVAFPVALSLFKKGAKFSVIFTYIGAAGICRIPMTVFEISFLGPKFSLIRLFVSIPLVILSSILLGNYLEKKNYTMPEIQD